MISLTCPPAQTPRSSGHLSQLSRGNLQELGYPQSGRWEGSLWTAQRMSVLQQRIPKQIPGATRGAGVRGATHKLQIRMHRMPMEWTRAWRWVWILTMRSVTISNFLNPYLFSRRTSTDLCASSEEWGRSYGSHSGATHSVCRGEEVLWPIDWPVELWEDHLLGPANEALSHRRIRTKALLRDGSLLSIQPSVRGQGAHQQQSTRSAPVERPAIIISIDPEDEDVDALADPLLRAEGSFLRHENGNKDIQTRFHGHGMWSIIGLTDPQWMTVVSIYCRKMRANTRSSHCRTVPSATSCWRQRPSIFDWLCSCCRSEDVFLRWVSYNLTILSVKVV